MDVAVGTVHTLSRRKNGDNQGGLYNEEDVKLI